MRRFCSSLKTFNRGGLVRHVLFPSRWLFSHLGTGSLPPIPSGQLQPPGETGPRCRPSHRIQLPTNLPQHLRLALHFNSSRPDCFPPTFKANAPCPSNNWQAKSETSASRIAITVVWLTSFTSFITRLYVLKKHSLSHLIR